MAQRHVKLLKKAKCYLNKNNELFVCYAIERASGTKYNKTGDEIKKYIMRAIWPQATLGNWLQTNGYSDGLPCARDDYVIDYRRRWVDHMIQNHEEFFGKD